MAEKDILVEIPDGDLPLLFDFYSRPDIIDKSPIVINQIVAAFDWKKSPEYSAGIQFYSPNNSWRIDGTIIIISTYTRSEVFMFTLEKSGDVLYRVLMETKRFDYKRGVIFAFIDEVHYPIVMTGLNDLNQEKNAQLRQLETISPAALLSVPPEVARNWTVDCPEEVYIKELTESDAKKVNDVYPPKFLRSEQWMRDIINTNGGWGVYLKSNHELISWVLRHRFGLGMLQTDENHKRKGYAALTLKAAAKDLAFQGIYAIGTVFVGNKGSMKLFEALGFENKYTGYYIFASEKCIENMY